MTDGETLKGYREALGYTQAEAARALGIEPNTFARKERDELPTRPSELSLLAVLASKVQ